MSSGTARPHEDSSRMADVSKGQAKTTCPHQLHLNPRHSLTYSALCLFARTLHLSSTPFQSLSPHQQREVPTSGLGLPDLIPILHLFDEYW